MNKITEVLALILTFIGAVSTILIEDNEKNKVDLNYYNKNTRENSHI